MFWESFPKCVNQTTHPRVFVRFGKTKGEIQVKKRGNFRGDLGGFGPCLGISPPIFGKPFPQKKFFFFETFPK